jgi:hypothetical protein
MKARLIYSLGALTLLLAACSGERPEAANDQPAAGSYGSYTARQGLAPNISPDSPAYSENGAPRAGQPSGENSAGAPSDTGNYAPLQHQDIR